MSTELPTPRTDAEEIHYSGGLVSAKFSRALKREINLKDELLRIATASMDIAIKERNDLNHQLATAQDDQKRLMWAIDHASDFAAIIDAIRWTGDADKNRSMWRSSIDAAMQSSPTLAREET